MASIVTFQAKTDQITAVAKVISKNLLASVQFTVCTSGRMGLFPALQLKKELLGFTIYLVRSNSRIPNEFSLELHCQNEHSIDDQIDADDEQNSRIKSTLLNDGVLLAEHLWAQLQSLDIIEKTT